MDTKEKEVVILNKCVCFYLTDYDIRIFRHIGDGKPREAIVDIHTYPNSPHELLGKVFNLYV